MTSIVLPESKRASAPPSHFNTGDSVRILPYDGLPPRRHAGECGIVRRVLKLYDYVDHRRLYDYWVEVGPDAWLYSESALEVAS